MEFRKFVRKEPILIISIVLAAVSLFLCPFDVVMSHNYGMIMKTICILFCFLIIVEGLKECNALKKLAEKVLAGKKNSNSLCFALVFLPFFTAMLFTNDVALITFVPFAIVILRTTHLEYRIPVVLVLQTMAANIGSSLTPFGNPHNLYMFGLNEKYGFSLLDYEMALIPIVLVGALVLVVLTSTIKKENIDFEIEKNNDITSKKKLAVIILLFIVAIATVIGFIPWIATTAIVAVAFLIMMPRAFKTVNYGILLVFFFLFVFTNNIASIESVSASISHLIAMDPMLTIVGVSQITSNVPSTILLEQFTTNWRAITVGADIGGFGTPIASMASIITLNLYIAEKGSDVKKYLAKYTLFNIVMLIALIPTYYLLVG